MMTASEQDAYHWLLKPADIPTSHTGRDCVRFVAVGMYPGNLSSPEEYSIPQLANPQMSVCHPNPSLSVIFVLFMPLQHPHA